MRIATIVPTAHLHLVRDDAYHLALAHSAFHDQSYRRFYAHQADRIGNLVILDNGAAEDGESMELSVLMATAMHVDATEVVLPDVIYDRTRTLRRSGLGLSWMESGKRQLLAVPQGDTPTNWVSCCLKMLQWDRVDTIGISKFVVVGGQFAHRGEALAAVPELLESDKAIHLLGAPLTPDEIAEINADFPGRIRGVDSSLPTLFTMEGRDAAACKWQPRPTVPLDLTVTLDEGLLTHNIQAWQIACKEGVS